MEFLSQTWPWYVSGPLISLVMFLLLYFGKNFGFSNNLRTMCSIGGAGKVADFFKFDWKSQKWNLFFVVGTILGGFIASQFLSSSGVQISETTIQQLSGMGVESPGSTLLPNEIFSLSDPMNILILLIGGVLVGFGSRYAGGCTSGHAISGLSDLQVPSLIAVIGFFIGGLIMSHFILPFIL